MTNRFTQKAQNALNRALTVASEMGHTYIGSEHILLSLLADTECVAAKILSARGADIEALELALTEISGIGSRTLVTPADMTPRTKHIIETAAHSSLQYAQSYIGTEHLLLAIAKDKQCMGAKILGDMGISVRELEDDIVTFLSSAPAQSKRALMSNNDNKKSKKGAQQIKSAPNLSKFGRDLTELAKNGGIDPIIARDSETERVIQILSRRTKNNPCLIGEPGVGKTAVVEGLAQRIADGTVCDSLKDKTIVTLDIPGMLAGAKYRGEFEDRMKSVMEEISADPSIILFIDEIHTIIGAGAAEGAVDAANILKPALARGELQVIGATTISEYRKHIEKDAALERRFQSVMVGEPRPEQAIRILHGLRDKYEAHHELKISNGAIEAAVSLSSRYIPDRFLPDKAIDLIDEAASKLRISAHTMPPELIELERGISESARNKEEAIISQDFEGAAKYRDLEKQLKKSYAELKKQWEKDHTIGDLTVGEEDIAEIVTQWTGIPVSKLLADEGQRLLELEEELHRRVIGQERAVNAVSNAIRRGRMGLRDPNRPIGSFIFLGPTGVGKTELTRALSSILFGTENALVRLDMSEYMEKHAVAKFIGSPPGYVGFEDGGQLTEKIRKHPYSVILFDEIEKAHPDVFNIMLQILDDGILTDAQGRRVDFKNTVIIMTSNLGASEILGVGSSKLGFNNDRETNEHIRIKDKVMAEVKRSFKPEFLNRIDEIIVFDRLKKEEINAIAKLMLNSLSKRLADNDISVSFTDSAISKIAEEGFDEVYGARPLRRAIQNKIEDMLSEKIIDGELASGESGTVDIKDDEFILVKFDNG